MNSDENNENHFYELVKKIQPLPQNLKQAELAALSSQVDRQKTQNVKPKIVSFQKASSEIHEMQDTLSKKSEINDNIEQLNEKAPNIYQFFNSNAELFNKMQESKLKRDFCRSLGLLCSLPNEIMKEVKNHNYQLATKYLISMMKFLSNKKYDVPVLNSVKQQFTPQYILELRSNVESDMFLHTNEDKFIHQSIQAVAFQISILYFDIAEINNPSATNDNESKRSSILEVLSTYFCSWTNSLLSNDTSEIFKCYVSSGKTLFIINSDIQKFIIELPYLNLAEKNQLQSFNNKLKNDINSISKKFYLSIYNKYVNFSQFDGLFYTKRKIFNINYITAFDEQSSSTKVIQESWGKLVPKAMSAGCIVLLNCILDLKEECQLLNDDNSGNIFELLKKFCCVMILLRKAKEGNNLPDFKFLKTSFQKFHTHFMLSSFEGEKIKTAFITFINFCLLFQTIPETIEVGEVIYSNFQTRIVSVLANYIINSSLRNASLTETFMNIDILLREVYNNNENTQAKKEKTFIDQMQISIQESSFNIYSILNLIVFQALNGITNYYIWEILDVRQFDKIKDQLNMIAEWYLKFMKKDIKASQNIIKPYISMLDSRVIK